MEAFKVTITADDENSTDSESTCLMAQHALSTESNTHNVTAQQHHGENQKNDFNEDDA